MSHVRHYSCNVSYFRILDLPSNFKQSPSGTGSKQPEPLGSKVMPDKKQDGDKGTLGVRLCVFIVLQKSSKRHFPILTLGALFAEDSKPEPDTSTSHVDCSTSNPAHLGAQRARLDNSLEVVELQS